MSCNIFFFFFQAEDGIRDFHVTGVQTCALPIWRSPSQEGHSVADILNAETQRRGERRDFLRRDLLHDLCASASLRFAFPTENQPSTFPSPPRIFPAGGRRSLPRLRPGERKVRTPSGSMPRRMRG